MDEPRKITARDVAWGTALGVIGFSGDLGTALAIGLAFELFAFVWRSCKFVWRSCQRVLRSWDEADARDRIERANVTPPQVQQIPEPEQTKEEKAAFAHKEFQRALDGINKRTDLTDGQKTAMGHDAMDAYLDTLKKLMG